MLNSVSRTARLKSTTSWPVLVHRAFTGCVRSEEYDDHLTLSLRSFSCMPSSHRALTVAIPCWPGRQEPSLTGYNVCWMPQPVSSVILVSSTEAWHICFTPSCTGSMFHSGSPISSEWQFTGVSKAGLPSTVPHELLPSHIGCCQSSATSIFQPPPSRRTTTSSQHARPSGVLRRRSDGLDWRPPRPVAQCR